MDNFCCFVSYNILDLAIMARMKFEVGRINNLGTSQESEKTEEKVAEKRPIGFWLLKLNPRLATN